MQNKISGVYKITNIITGDCYIGSSKNIKFRWACHRQRSAWGQQPNSKLYKDMSKYGLDNFTIDILEETLSYKEREQYWIDQLKPSYNIRRAYGRKHYNRTYNRTTKQLDQIRAWLKVHHVEHLAKNKAYYSRLCIYENETLTLGNLSVRFQKQGIPHPCKEAKKYLL